MKNDDLEQRARELFPENETHQRRWIDAVRWLRSQNKWIADPGVAPPDWAKGVERIAA